MQNISWLLLALASHLSCVYAVLGIKKESGREGGLWSEAEKNSSDDQRR